MNLSKIKLFLIGIGLVLSLSLNAQNTSETSSEDGAVAEMADVMRSNGKIYVVVAILVTIFGGLIFYTVRLDRKISKLEKGEDL